jgi:hypothetical protein
MRSGWGGRAGAQRRAGGRESEMGAGVRRAGCAGQRHAVPASAARKSARRRFQVVLSFACAARRAPRARTSHGSARRDPRRGPTPRPPFPAPRPTTVERRTTSGSVNTTGTLPSAILTSRFARGGAASASAREARRAGAGASPAALCQRGCASDDARRALANMREKGKHAHLRRGAQVETGRA